MSLSTDDSGKRLGRVDLTKSLNKVVKDKLKAGDLSALDTLRAKCLHLQMEVQKERLRDRRL